MAVFNFVNNALGQLFDVLEGHMGGAKFATFSMSEVEKVAQGSDGNEKVFMKQYEKEHDEVMYKYLYDPDLSFDDRFHQRLASVSIKDRNEPWVTLMFNTGAVRSLTNVYSCNNYFTVNNSDGDYFDIKAKRVSVPVNMVLISNDMTYLYSILENLTLFFDRVINYEYVEYVAFPTGTEDEYERKGQVTDITEVNLEKLDTSSRGSLASAAYTFNLVYWVSRYPEQCNLLERIIVNIAVKGQGKLCTLIVK